MNLFNFNQFPSVSAFVQQREKIMPEAFRYLLLEFNKEMHIYPKLYTIPPFGGRGSDLSLPFNQKEPETIRINDHCNFLHLNALYDVCSKLYLNASIYSGTKSGETAAIFDLIRKLPEKYPVILIADREYKNYNLFAHIE